MGFSSVRRRRPSAALVVSFVALFVALGGVGYAATQLPANSVGSTQLKNGSVGNWKLKFNSVGARKIINGSVGAKQVNSRQVQLRVSTGCNPGSAIQSIGLSGSVSCTATLPNEAGTSASTVPVGANYTPIASLSLPAGSSHLVMAFAHADISSGVNGTPTENQRVDVACTLSVPPGTGSATTVNQIAVDLGTDGASLSENIPLVLPVASATAAQAATVSCAETSGHGVNQNLPDASVLVSTTINAIQTASNN
jgi:hypothetical protein